MKWPCMSREKQATTYAVVELDYGDGSYEGCQGQAGISLQRWSLLGVASFLATSG